MCGIAGGLSLAGGSGPDREVIARMLAALVHRGPDDTGAWADGPVGLGNTRLSLVDLAGGRQPVANEDETVRVVFNGEVFNHVELREGLRARGHAFRTASDTEVLVHLYEEHGADFVHPVNGQLAAALWDARRRRLVLARDRAGERPLYWTVRGGTLWFASEVKALMEVPGLSLELDPQALAEVFTTWAPLAPRSPFAGIRSLPAGHRLVVEGGRWTEERYWDWGFPHAEAYAPATEREAVAAVRAAMEESVRLRLRADVPVGAYLSGGLDSSIVTAVAARQLGSPPYTFSIRFEDGELDEGAFQRDLVRHLGTDHTEVPCRAADIRDAFQRTVWHTEAPILRTAPVPLLLLADRVRAAGLKAVLTGEGADEVFAGYDLFKEARLRRFAARHPESGLPERLLPRLYRWLERSPTRTKAFAAAWLDHGTDADAPSFGHRPRFESTRRAWRFFTPELRSRLRDPVPELEATLPGELARWHPLCRDQYLEARTLLAGYLLSSQGDRVAMGASVEARLPFLDPQLIDVASRLPPGLKLHGLDEKHVLKRAFADLLPASILARDKQPYRAPDSRCFFVDGRAVAWVADLLSPERLRRRGWFDAAAVGRLVEKCARGLATGFADNAAFVGILSAQVVERLFVERAGRA